MPLLRLRSVPRGPEQSSTTPPHPRVFATEALRGTIGIAPTVTKHQGGPHPGPGRPRSGFPTGVPVARVGGGPISKEMAAAHVERSALALTLLELDPILAGEGGDRTVHQSTR